MPTATITTAAPLTALATLAATANHPGINIRCHTTTDDAGTATITFDATDRHNAIAVTYPATDDDADTGAHTTAMSWADMDTMATMCAHNRINITATDTGVTATTATATAQFAPADTSGCADTTTWMALLNRGHHWTDVTRGLQLDRAVRSGAAIRKIPGDYVALVATVGEPVVHAVGLDDAVTPITANGAGGVSLADPQVAGDYVVGVVAKKVFAACVARMRKNMGSHFVLCPCPSRGLLVLKTPATAADTGVFYGLTVGAVTDPAWCAAMFEAFTASHTGAVDVADTVAGLAQANGI